MTCPNPHTDRRSVIALAVLGLLGAPQASGAHEHPNPVWYEAALAMRLLAESWGDQAYGAVLYSTARPCAACERAAARAGVARMYVGPALRDAGVPAGGE